MYCERAGRAAPAWTPAPLAGRTPSAARPAPSTATASCPGCCCRNRATRSVIDLASNCHRGSRARAARPATFGSLVRAVRRLDAVQLVRSPKPAVLLHPDAVIRQQRPPAAMPVRRKNRANSDVRRSVVDPRDHRDAHRTAGSPSRPAPPGSRGSDSFETPGVPAVLPVSIEFQVVQHQAGRAATRRRTSPRGANPQVSSAVSNSPLPAGRAGSLRANRGCETGSPPDKVTPPPDSSKNTDVLLDLSHDLVDTHRASRDLSGSRHANIDARRARIALRWNPQPLGRVPNPMLRACRQALAA